jgi:hypothetical protein
VIPWWVWALLTAAGVALMIWVTATVFTLAPAP